MNDILNLFLNELSITEKNIPVEAIFNNVVNKNNLFGISTNEEILECMLNYRKDMNLLQKIVNAEKGET